MPLLFREEKKGGLFPLPWGEGGPRSRFTSSGRGPGEGLLSLPG